MQENTLANNQNEAKLFFYIIDAKTRWTWCGSLSEEEANKLSLNIKKEDSALLENHCNFLIQAAVKSGEPHPDLETALMHSLVAKIYYEKKFGYLSKDKIESSHFLFACDIYKNYKQITYVYKNNDYISYQEIWRLARNRIKLENESDSEKKATGAELGSKKFWKAVKYSLLGSWYFFLYALVVLSWSLVFIDTSQIPKEYAKDDPERIVWGFSTERVSSSLAGQSFRFALKERKCADCDIRDYELNTDQFCNVAGTCSWERIPVRQTNGLKEDAAYLHNIPAELCKGAVATIDTYVQNNGERVSRYKIKPIEFAFFDEGKLFIKTDQVVRYGCVKMSERPTILKDRGFERSLRSPDSVY